MRMGLNDRAIARLAPPESGQYNACDVELKGFNPLIGKRRLAFLVHGDIGQAGKRLPSIKMMGGDAPVMNAPVMSVRDAGSIAHTSRGQSVPQYIDSIITAYRFSIDGRIAGKLSFKPEERKRERHLIGLAQLI